MNTETIIEIIEKYLHESKKEITGINIEEKYITIDVKPKPTEKESF